MSASIRTLFRANRVYGAAVPANVQSVGRSAAVHKRGTDRSESPLEDLLFSFLFFVQMLNSWSCVLWLHCGNDHNKGWKSIFMSYQKSTYFIITFLIPPFVEVGLCLSHSTPSFILTLKWHDRGPNFHLSFLNPWLCRLTDTLSLGIARRLKGCAK